MTPEHHANSHPNTRETERLPENSRNDMRRDLGLPPIDPPTYVARLGKAPQMLDVFPAYLRAGAFFVGWLLIGNAIALEFDAKTWVHILITGVLVIALAPSARDSSLTATAAHQSGSDDDA